MPQICNYLICCLLSVLKDCHKDLNVKILISKLCKFNIIVEVIDKIRLCRSQFHSIGFKLPPKLHRLVIEVEINAIHVPPNSCLQDCLESETKQNGSLEPWKKAEMGERV